MRLHDPPPKKALVWIGSSKKDLIAMPVALRKEFGVALDIAQQGLIPEGTKLLKGKAAGRRNCPKIITATPIAQFTRSRWKTASMCCTASRRNRRRAQKHQRPISMWLKHD